VRNQKAAKDFIRTETTEYVDHAQRCGYPSC
jgi:hypothetical protein